MIFPLKNLYPLLKWAYLIILEIDSWVTLIGFALDDIPVVFVFLLKNHLKMVAMIHELWVLLIRNIAIISAVHQKLIVLFIDPRILALKSFQFIHIQLEFINHSVFLSQIFVLLKSFLELFLQVLIQNLGFLTQKLILVFQELREILKTRVSWKPFWSLFLGTCLWSCLCSWADPRIEIGIILFVLVSWVDRLI